MSRNLTNIINKGYSSISPKSIVTICNGKRIPEYVLQHAAFILNDVTGATINSSDPTSGILLYFDRSINTDEYVLRCENKSGLVILLQWAIIGFKF